MALWCIDAELQLKHPPTTIKYAVETSANWQNIGNNMGMVAQHTPPFVHYACTVKKIPVD